MKIPNVGALAHMETMEAFAQCFPKGVVNFISGAGRETMPPIMATGKVDIFAFIGTSKAADALVKEHPAPHRLKNCLSLEAKNVGIVCKDADIDEAVTECCLGALSYNGQRCTAIKQIMVHKDVAEEFVAKFSAKVGSLKLALPWEAGADLTPLPEPSKPQYLAELREDAKSKGAKIISPGADQNWSATAVFPSIVYPVTKDMRVMQEEQFGPLVPIATFSDLREVEEYVMNSMYGQQAAVFSKGTEPAALGPLLDLLAHSVARVNLNCQCQRSPDNFPFTGRKSSALGTLSVVEALKVMSMESLVATKRKNEALMALLADSKQCKFLSAL
jgi:glyceraldehyde-3-phosphate dehydrogenase (NADP+)